MVPTTFKQTSGRCGLGSALTVTLSAASEPPGFPVLSMSMPEPVLSFPVVPGSPAPLLGVEPQPFGTTRTLPGEKPERIGRSLERSGLITRDIENAYLAFDPGDEAPVNVLLGHAITYRIATGPREGQKVFTLQTLPADPERARIDVAESSGFSLHAGVSARGSDREKLEHLARYISRPPVDPTNEEFFASQPNTINPMQARLARYRRGETSQLWSART